jgi:RNA recognition motif-containing protein
VHAIDGKRIICEKAKCTAKKDENDRSFEETLSVDTSTSSTHEENSKFDVKSSKTPSAKSPEEIDCRRIWVGGISKSLTDNDLYAFFSSYGEVEQSFVVTDDRGRSKGFAYVTFSSPSSASSVLKQECIEISGRTVTTKSALPESVMNKNKIYVCNLDENTEESTLFNYFKKFGSVVEAVIKDAGSHRFAFIRFESKDSVEQVFDIQSHIIDGKMVHCERANGSRRLNSKNTVDGTRGADQSVSGFPLSSNSMSFQNKLKFQNMDRSKRF